MSLVEIARSQIGIKEISGHENSPAILNYAKETGFQWVNDDETPWCSIFANWVAMKAGMERSHKANARSWLTVGKPVTKPIIGDVVVFRRGKSEWQGHVGFYMGENENFIYVLGGNQSNQVKISKYSKSDFLGYRRLNPVL